MRKKRFLSAVCALTMTFGMTTAFAEETVKVTFEENNGEEAYTFDVEKGIPMHELPVPGIVVDGKCVFDGWYKDAECTERFSITESINEPLTLYAGWSVLPFDDVKVEDKFFENIQYVYYSNIMNGVAEDKFAPDSPLTRAMLVTILYRMEGEPAFMNDLIFDDVVHDSYYEKAVIWANGKGIVNGVSETSFAPDMNVTREQMAAIFYRYLKYKGVDMDALSEDTNTLSYDDVFDVAEWAQPAMHACLANDIIVDRDGMVEPANDATRAEAAKAISSADVLFSLSIASSDIDYSALEGEYQDQYSGRAVMTMSENNEGGFDITVHWANSASEYVEWAMSAYVDAKNRLVYEDASKKIVALGDEGKESTEELAYENGTGYFTLTNNGILWDGAAEESCVECVFEHLVQMPNPMEETSKDGILEKLGFEFNVPEDAENVKYFIINEELAQMDFELNGTKMTARIKAEAEFTDISGIYYPWTVEEDGAINGLEGKTMRFIGEDGTVDCCLWFNAVPGIMYSLTAEAKDLDGFDITAVAQQVYVPVQGDAE